MSRLRISALSIKRKKKDDNILPVSVVGLSSGECDVDFGVGKSSFCSRFVRPSFDDYEAVKSSLSSCISESDFAHPVVNNSHFLYYPPVRLSLESKSSDVDVTFHVIEQTVFTNDATLRPFRGAERYIERAAQQYLRSDGKLAFTSRDGIGNDDDQTEGFPSELFRKFGVKGFVCVYDPTLKGQRKFNQERMLCQLIKRIKAKVKAAIVLVVVKCDTLSSRQAGSDVEGAQTLAKKFKIPLIFASAHENVNVRETFIVLAQMVLHKKLKETMQLKGLTEYAEANEEHNRRLHKVQKDFGILLYSMVRHLESTWSVLKPKLEGRAAFDKFVHIFGISKAKVQFQTRILHVAIEEWNRRWGEKDHYGDKGQSRAIKQEVLREMLQNHEDFDSNIDDSDYDFIPWLQGNAIPCNEYESVFDPRLHSLTREGTIAMASTLAHSITTKKGTAAEAYNEECGDSFVSKSSSENESIYESVLSDDDVAYEKVLSDNEHDYENIGPTLHDETNILTVKRGEIHQFTSEEVNTKQLYENLN